MLGKVIVKIKPSIKPRRERFAIQDDRPDKCRSVIAILLQQFRQRRVRRIKRNGEIRYAMRAWKQTSKNGGVRGVRNGTRREGLRIAYALASQ